MLPPGSCYKFQKKNQLRNLISILHRWRYSTAAKAAQSQKSLWCSIETLSRAQRCSYFSPRSLVQSNRLHLLPVRPVCSEAHFHDVNNRFEALSQPAKNGWSRKHQMSRSTFVSSLYGRLMSCSIVPRTNSWQDAANAYKNIVKNIQCSRSAITPQHLCKLRLDSWRFTKKSTVRRLLPLINATTYTQVCSLTVKYILKLNWKKQHKWLWELLIISTSNSPVMLL